MSLRTSVLFLVFIVLCNAVIGVISTNETSVPPSTPPVTPTPVTTTRPTPPTHPASPNPKPDPTNLCLAKSVDSCEKCLNIPGCIVVDDECRKADACPLGVGFPFCLHTPSLKKTGMSVEQACGNFSPCSDADSCYGCMARTFPEASANPQQKYQFPCMWDAVSTDVDDDERCWLGCPEGKDCSQWHNVGQGRCQETEYCENLEDDCISCAQGNCAFTADGCMSATCIPGSSFLDCVKGNQTDADVIMHQCAAAAYNFEVQDMCDTVITCEDCTAVRFNPDDFNPFGDFNGVDDEGDEGDDDEEDPDDPGDEGLGGDGLDEDGDQDAGDADGQRRLRRRLLQEQRRRQSSGRRLRPREDVFGKTMRRKRTMHTQARRLRGHKPRRARSVGVARLHDRKQPISALQRTSHRRAAENRRAVVDTVRNRVKAVDVAPGRKVLQVQKPPVNSDGTGNAGAGADAGDEGEGEGEGPDGPGGDDSMLVFACEWRPELASTSSVEYPCVAAEMFSNKTWDTAVSGESIASKDHGAPKCPVLAECKTLQGCEACLSRIDCVFQEGKCYAAMCDDSRLSKDPDCMARTLWSGLTSKELCAEGVIEANKECRVTGQSCNKCSSIMTGTPPTRQCYWHDDEKGCRLDLYGDVDPKEEVCPVGCMDYTDCQTCLAHSDSQGCRYDSMDGGKTFACMDGFCESEHEHFCLGLRTPNANDDPNVDGVVNFDVKSIPKACQAQVDVYKKQDMCINAQDSCESCLKVKDPVTQKPLCSWDVYQLDEPRDGSYCHLVCDDDQQCDVWVRDGNLKQCTNPPPLDGPLPDPKECSPYNGDCPSCLSNNCHMIAGKCLPGRNCPVGHFGGLGCNPGVPTDVGDLDTILRQTCGRIKDDEARNTYCKSLTGGCLQCTRAIDKQGHHFCGINIFSNTCELACRRGILGCNPQVYIGNHLNCPAGSSAGAAPASDIDAKTVVLTMLLVLVTIIVAAFVGYKYHQRSLVARMAAREHFKRMKDDPNAISNAVPMRTVSSANGAGPPVAKKSTIGGGALNKGLASHDQFAAVQVNE